MGQLCSSSWMNVVHSLQKHAAHRGHWLATPAASHAAHTASSPFVLGTLFREKE